MFLGGGSNPLKNYKYVSKAETKYENLRKQEMNNSKEHFRFPFNDVFMSIVFDHMMQNKEFYE